MYMGKAGVRLRCEEVDGVFEQGATHQRHQPYV